MRTLPTTLNLVASGLFFSFLIAITAISGEALSLEAYLSQVKSNNSGVRGALLGSQGSEQRSTEGRMLVEPMAFGLFQYGRDARISQFSFLGFDSLETKTLSIGVSQTTRFGLVGKLHYDIVSTSYINPVSLFSLPGGGGGEGGTSLIQTSYANASPVLELSQSLWGNGFGRSTQASQEQMEAQALASSYGSRFQAKAELSRAEMSYWTLALARQAVSVQKQALDRAKKIYEWSSRRARLHLADASEALQAEALMQTRELDLITAQNQERSASRAFNSARNKDSDTVEEALMELDAQMTDGIQIPQRAPIRDDVKAAQQAARAAIASATIGYERDLPTLELFGSLALNGQRSPSAGIPAGYLAYTNISDAIGPSFSFNRPSYTVGLKFSTSLDIGTAGKVREGWKLERVAAELTSDRKVFEQEEEWKHLNESWVEAKKHLELTRKLEKIQEKKLEAERTRLQQGRTITYQVLLFEQDYLLTQLARIRDQAQLLTLIAQMKTFGDSL